MLKTTLLTTLSVLGLASIPLTANAQSACLHERGERSPTPGQALENATKPCPVTATKDEIIVSVTRAPIALLKLGQSVTVLDETDIRAQQSVQVSDLLAKTTDFHVVRNGGPGQTTSGFIRGADSDQTLYILDGVRLSDPSQVGGGANLGLLPNLDIGRIEILRGPYSTLWGSRALGGVVAVTSREATKPFEPRFVIEGGEDYANASVSVSGKSDHLSYRLSGQQTHDAGVSAYAGGTESDGFDQTALSGDVTWRFSDHTGVTLRAAHTHSRTEFDGYPAPFYSFADTLESGKIKDNLVSLRFFTQNLSGRLAQSLTLSSMETRSRFLNDDKTPNYLSTGRVESLDYTGNYQIDATTRALWIITREQTEMTTAYPASWDPNPVPFKADTGRTSLAGQLQKAFSDVLNLNVSLRHEDDDAYGTRDLGHAAISYKAQDNLVLRAAVGQGFKAPSLYQLYSDYGNARLNPETSVSYEAGFDLFLANEALRISTSLFERRTTDQIGFFSCFGSSDPRCVTQPYGFYENIARARAHGLEVESEYATAWGGALKANLTRLVSRDEAPASFNYKNDLARRPRTLANIDYSQPLTDTITVGASYSFSGKAFDDAANSRVLKAYGLIDLRAAWAFKPGFELFARVENANDARYETAAGYGSTGRRVWVGLRLN
jgi:vitamin B12 transporter